LGLIKAQQKGGIEFRTTFLNEHRHALVAISMGTFGKGDIDDPIETSIRPPTLRLSSLGKIYRRRATIGFVCKSDLAAFNR